MRKMLLIADGALPLIEEKINKEKEKERIKNMPKRRKPKIIPERDSQGINSSFGEIVSTCVTDPDEFTCIWGTSTR